MKKFILANLDPIVLALILVATLAYTLLLARKMAFRRLPLFFVVFGAMTICLAMVAHIGENSFHAVEQAMAGTFVYNFTFYARIFMGVVFLAMSLHMLAQIKVWGMGNRSGKINFIKTAAALSLLSFPTYFLVPIGLVPTLACALSLAGMPFAKKRRKPEPVLQGV
jgi:hypothetical protein